MESAKSKIKRIYLQLVLREGYTSVSMAKLSAASKVSVGNIYHHYASKQEILEELYNDVHEELGNTMFQSITKTATYRERFWLIWTNMYEFYNEHESYFTFLQQLKSLRLIRSESRRIAHIHLYPLDDFLQLGVITKELKSVELIQLHSIFMAHMELAVEMHLSGELIMTEERLEQQRRVCWDALRNNL